MRYRKLLMPRLVARASIIPWARPSHGSWNGGSPASATTGPNPSMPPRSWMPSTDAESATRVAAAPAWVGAPPGTAHASGGGPHGEPKDSSIPPLDSHDTPSSHLDHLGHGA